MRILLSDVKINELFITMRKQILILAALFVATVVAKAACEDGPYKLVVNGSQVADFVDGGTSPDNLPQLNVQYSIKSGDVVEFENASCGDKFFPQTIETGGDVDGSSFFTVGATSATCSKDGCYNFWWKKQFGADRLYIGTDGNCSGGGGGDNGGGDGGTDCADGPYAVLVNGKTYFAAEYVDPFEDYIQYKASVQLAANDTWVLANTSCSATWVPAIEEGGESAQMTASAEAVTCKTAGCYDFYIKMKAGDDKVYIGKGENCGNGSDNPGDNTSRSHYSTQVPSNCPDVMLQAFYWDSNNDKGYGDTKWATLQKQASEIAAYFDLVWLPPSAKSSGGVGYHPSQYSNQSSDWGSRADLEKLISTLHAGGSKVVADIVINHVNNKSTWCDFYPLDFGTYGKFTPDASWIANQDEMNYDKSAGACFGKATGGNDDGYGDESNYTAARDWSHNKAEVRKMCAAYLKWMYNVMMYDGWRYDYCKGFHTSHVGDYNKQSQAYFSVMEWWDGNPNTLKSRIEESGNNTLTFDFATKYDAFNKGIAAGNFNGCKGSGLLGMGLSKYAVTFVDSHDSFTRDDNEMCGKNNSMKYPDKIKQANAFIICMPGVPCVFYPHWVKFKADLGPMIVARHEAGVHSQSAVKDESAEAGGYAATIVGTNGELRLLLGNKAGENPSGFTKACSGNGWAVWKKVSKAVAPKLIIEPGSQVFKDKTAGLSVSMRTVPTGGKIYYTTDGSDPKSSSTKKTYSATIKITETTTIKAYAENGGAATDVQTVTYTYKEPQDVNKDPITLRFNPNGAWQKVYVYTWGNHDVGAWPGLELTNKDANGWYSYDLPAGVKDINFIFNCGNGCEQTGNLFADEDVCYSWSGGAEKLEEDCKVSDPGDALEEVEVAGTKVSIYPNPVLTELNIQTEVSIRNTYIYNVTGQCQMTTEGNQKTINVSSLPTGMYILQLQTTNGTQATQMFIKQ